MAEYQAAQAELDAAAHAQPRVALATESVFRAKPKPQPANPDEVDQTPEPIVEPIVRGSDARTEAWLASMGKSLSDFEHSYFYSDSHNDIPLLEKVTDPIATNPDDTLRAHAQARGWRILELFPSRD